MKTKVLVLLLAAGLLAISGCKVTFTSGIRSQIEANGLDLKDVQFYTSQRIVLKRVLNSKDANVKSGQVRLENGMYIEEIEFKKGTEGVAEEILESGILVRFEQGEGRVLMFEPSRAFGEYELKTERWERSNADSQYSEFFSMYNGEVTYEGEKYYINSRLSKPGLKIKKKETNRVTVNRRRASGVRVK